MMDSLFMEIYVSASAYEELPTLCYIYLSCSATVYMHVFILT